MVNLAVLGKAPELHCAEQGLGQHIGNGTPSATADVAPRAKSSSVVTTILRTDFFMCFSPNGEFGVFGKVPELYCAEHGSGQHIGAGNPSALAKVGA